jgi:hypothetical protein
VIRPFLFPLALLVTLIAITSLGVPPLTLLIWSVVS